MKISFANTLAEICEAIPGADVDKITRTLGADRRIAPYGLKGGLPFGGPCFPRDNRAFAAFAEGYGVNAQLAKTTDEVNLGRAQRVVDIVERQLSRVADRKVSILGLAYKAETPVIEESPAVFVLQKLLRRDDTEITVYDQWAIENARTLFGNRIVYASSVRECISRSSLCVIMTQSDEFRRIDASHIVQNPTTILDCWRILDASLLGEKARYVALGFPLAESQEGFHRGR